MNIFRELWGVWESICVGVLALLVIAMCGLIGLILVGVLINEPEARVYYGVVALFLFVLFTAIRKIS